MAAAPNSGDGPDGSGMENPIQNGNPDSVNGDPDSVVDFKAPGPAPNSGDGIPDGSGF